MPVTKKSKKDELYEAVTAKIVEALEQGASGDQWSAPWHASAAELPHNVASKKSYRGVNTMILWAEQMLKGYESSTWGTYRQWFKDEPVLDDEGNPTFGDNGVEIRRAVRYVRKGEKGTTVLLWKPTSRKSTDANGEESTKASLYTTSYTVFNASQVEGYEPPNVVERDPFEVLDHAQAFFAQLGADVRHGGDRAYYSPGLDAIQLPNPETFVDNVSYYATAAHEHVHWTAHKSRCDRDLAGRFGDKQYAAEELIAEMGSAFVCAVLGLSNEPRADHAHYISSWIELLRDDSSAIITAGSKAQQAVDYLIGHSRSELPEEGASTEGSDEVLDLARL